jgi:hypothetical protein
VAANFSLYDDHGKWVNTSSCESVTPGAAMRFPLNSDHNLMPTDKNMSLTLTLYAYGTCKRTYALWDYSGVPTPHRNLQYQWITQSDWEVSARGDIASAVDGKPGHSWFAGQHCPAICPR